MAIRPLNDSRTKWQIDYYPAGGKGKRVQQVFHGSEAEARALEAELRRAHAGSMPVNPRIVDAVPEFLEWLRLHRSPAYCESWRWALKNLLPHFGRLPVNRITETVVNQYQALRRETPRACNQELEYLKILVSWMVERNLAQPLPFRIHKLPYHAPLSAIPHPDALDRFMAEVHDPMKRAMLLIMVGAGLRFKEARHLRWEQIDWEHGTIMLTVTKRMIPRLAIMPDDASEILRERRQDSGWVFPNPRTGEPYGSLKTLFKGAGERSGVKIKGPHTLRHTCGTYTWEATGDIRLVQLVLGHTHIKTTERYTHSSVEHMRAGIKKTAHYTSGKKRR